MWLMRNLNLRNFGLKNRDMGRALHNAYQENGNGYTANATVKTSLHQFAQFLKESGVRDLKNVQKEHVKAYAQQLLERYENDSISASTAQNYLSAINVAMSNARMDKQCHINPVKDSGFPTKSGIAEMNKSVTYETLEEVKRELPARLSAQLNLQRTLGLRFKESALIDAKKSLTEAIETGKVTIENGTKGGRARVIPITGQPQIHALENASKVQENNRSLIPKALTWAQYQNTCYKEMENKPFNFHDLRHSYAHERYQTLLGQSCPVQANISHKDHHQYLSKQLACTIEDAKQRDHTVRAQISRELGHNRISITNNYLG